ncbi:glycosyltransferase [Chroococcidiopsis sp. TS-821]|uniref:glycosyltransferase n=1 Tax=Chroococcidiopsis sp. TS-821 TaxID=1378066 RepID=UPI000CEE96F7|nr:glycosyltransferase [Chroococcidiopsis sp. TS-821]PPS42804.1 family 2 glycosyl transferase [Chroococcidiopsis sp. TS-821]
MEIAISVIICTHNPNLYYLDKVLMALKSQTLVLEQWELLLVDNANRQLLSKEIDLTWHPQARHIREEELGLTPARLRGIKEARGHLLVFVDDDNVLEQNYLEVALQISKNWSNLGAWGGIIQPEFEQQPPEWTKPYWIHLAIRDFDRDKWSNLAYQNETTPCGAGMCVRKVVAEKYAELLHNDSRRSQLDRRGKQLISCGDTDLALTSCDIGLGTGNFTALKLTHLIPSNRLQEDYLVKLLEGIGYSVIILDFLRGKVPTPLSWKRKLFAQLQLWQMSQKDRLLIQAFQKGESRALKEVLNT